MTEKSRSNTDTAPPIFQFFTEIGIIDQLVRTKLERVLPDGMKISQFAVLNHLVRLSGSWSPARLANAFQVTKAAMTNTLQRLSARGLIVTEDDPEDGRGKLVSLLPAGREMREQCIHRIAPAMAELEMELSEKKFVAALPFLVQLRTYLDENR